MSRTYRGSGSAENHLSRQAPPPIHFFNDPSPDSSEWSETTMSNTGAMAGRYTRVSSRPNGVRPNQFNGRIDGNRNELLPNSSHGHNEEFLNQLKASNRRMDCCFKVLVVVFVVVLLVYATVISLVISMSRLNALAGQDSQSVNGPPSQSSPDATPPFCVAEELFMEFKNKLDPESRLDMFDILKDSGYSRMDKGKVCFSSLKWVPQIMVKIHSAAHRSMSYIEERQKLITDTVDRYTGNNTGHRCNSSGDSTGGNPNNPTGLAVFAQYFLNTSASYPDGSSSNPLRWTREGVKGSTRRNIDVSIGSGEFGIRYSGFYFIYSHVLFKDSVTSPNHCVRKRSQHEVDGKTLLESQTSPTSVLQGIFQLIEGDRLQVTADTRHLNAMGKTSTYFGIYLIRT